MSTAIQAPTTTKAEKKAKEPRERRSFNVRLDGADGASLRITASRKKDGTAMTFAVHTTKNAKGKKTNAKGASERHPSIEAARAAQQKLVAQATKLGWKVREVRRGFVTQPDAFDSAHLPAPKRSVLGSPAR